jgi:hypothetical protein
VLVVKSDGALDGVVANHVAAGQVLCDNAGTGLILLLNVIAITSALIAGGS